LLETGITKKKKQIANKNPNYN